MIDRQVVRRHLDLKGEALEILVSGATGFLGLDITLCLLGAGHTVRALTHSPQRALQRFKADERSRAALQEDRLKVVEGDVTRAETLLLAVENTQVVVQAAQFKGAPVEDPANGLTYEDVDHRGTVNLLRAIRTAGCKPRFLYVSGITVQEDATRPWDVAKWKAEEAIRASGLEWTVVRLCWAYGPRDKALNRLLGYSDLLPFVPVFGDGRQPLTPVFAQDVARLFARVVDDAEASQNAVFRLGGPEEVTLDQFLRAALQHMGRQRPILHVPVPLGRLSAGVAQHLPWRPLTPDAVDFVAQAGAVTDDDRRMLSGRLPDFVTTSLHEGLASYLGK